MSVIDSKEVSLKRIIARQKGELAQLRQVILWQAEGSRPDGTWTTQSPPSTDPSSATVASSSSQLTWSKTESRRPARRAIPLPVEVLAEIASCVVDRADLVSLGKASFELLTVAMRELMERRPVQLETAKQTTKMFCHRGRAEGFPFWMTGNQKRLRPVLNLTHLQHISIPFFDDDHYAPFYHTRWNPENLIYADRVTIPTHSDLVHENVLTPFPQPQDRVRLVSLIFTFPIGLDDWEKPMAKEHPGSWFGRLLALFDPLNFVLVRTPTPEHPVARLMTDGLDRWTRLERCICIGVVPEVNYWPKDRIFFNEDGSDLTEWPTQDGLPQLVIFLVGPKEVFREDRKLLGRTCAARLDEEWYCDENAVMRWNVQFWLQDEDAVKKEKADLKQTHPKGIVHATGEHFEIDWKTWTRGTNGDDRHTRLFGLPFEEDGWLSQAWFDKHDLE